MFPLSEIRQNQLVDQLGTGGADGGDVHLVDNADKSFHALNPFFFFQCAFCGIGLNLSRGWLDATEIILPAHTSGISNSLPAFSFWACFSTISIFLDQEGSG